MAMDEWGRMYDDLEKEENPFKITFKIIKLIIKLAWRGIVWTIKSIKKMVLWIMRRRNQNQQQYPRLYNPQYPQYPNQAN